MNIGSVIFTGRAFLAPMAGVSDMPFRKICAAMGAALTYTEMVSAKGLLYSPDRSAGLLLQANDGKPTALQLFGNDPELMADMALKHGVGYEIVDVNMGCPVPKVVKDGQGSALMLQPELASRIVRVMADRVNVPVTVKIRKGWDDNSINVVDFARLMADSGAAAIAVHGRTREQYYSGKADWACIAEVKNAVSVPVIGSGDVFSGKDGYAMLQQTGCDAVMVARGAQGNPWIFAEINALLSNEPYLEPAIEERLRVAWEHAEGLRAIKDDHIAIQEMRKHLCWYIKGVPQAARWRNTLNAVASFEELKGILSQIIH